jgi:hypothetical protein
MAAANAFMASNDDIRGITIKGVVMLSNPQSSQRAAILLGQILQAIVDTHHRAMSNQNDPSELQQAFFSLCSVESKATELASLLEEIPARCPFPDIKPNLDTKLGDLRMVRIRLQNGFQRQRDEMGAGGELTKESVQLVFKAVFDLIQAVVELLMANDATFRKITELTVLEALKWLKRVKDYSAATDLSGDVIKVIATDAGQVVPSLVRKVRSRRPSQAHLC